MEIINGELLSDNTLKKKLSNYCFYKKFKPLNAKQTKFENRDSTSLEGMLPEEVIRRIETIISKNPQILLIEGILMPPRMIKNYIKNPIYNISFEELKRLIRNEITGNIDKELSIVFYDGNDISDFEKIQLLVSVTDYGSYYLYID